MARRKSDLDKDPSASPMVPPAKGIEILRRQIEAGETLLAKRSLSESDFDSWCAVSERCLVRAFGDGSERHYNFMNTGTTAFFSARSLFDEDSPQNEINERRQWLKEKIASLEASVEVLKLDAEIDAGPIAEGSKAKIIKGDSVLDVFISHSSKDKVLAYKLVELVRSALPIRPGKIRCTSVEGYRLSIGSNTDEQLRKEVHAARAFVGLITPASLQSAYVLFELGARWGAKRPLAPLLGSGATADLLKGPLREISTLSCDVEADLHQFVTDIAKVLNLIPAPSSVYQHKIAEVAQSSRSSGQESSIANETSAGNFPGYTGDDIAALLEAYLERKIGRSRNKTLLHFADVDRELHLRPGTAASFLPNVARELCHHILREGGETLLIDSPLSGL
jgi:hypothetical protein